MTRFATDPLEYISGREEERAVAALASYTSTYAGAWFNALADPNPYEITANDLVAVTTLGVQVPEHVAIWLTLERENLGGRERDQSISALLQSVGPDRSIRDVKSDEVNDVYGSKSAAYELWSRLQRGRWPAPKKGDHNGVGPVTAGKLLAAKRPDLIPVWDQWVQAGLGAPVGGFWVAMWNAFQNDTFMEQLDRVRSAAMLDADNAKMPTPAVPGLLRTFDIIVWMRVYGCRFSLDRKTRGLEGKPLGER